jgi:transcriptional regulator with XRE-family HTH domain
MIPPMADEQDGARRLAEALRRRLARTGLPLGEIDQRMGWAENTLSELLNGTAELRVKELLAVLRAVGIEERSFFAELYDLEPRCRATSGQGEIPYSIGHLSKEDAPAFPATEEILALFRELVGEAVHRDLRSGEVLRTGVSGPFDETDLLDGHRRGD